VPSRYIRPLAKKTATAYCAPHSMCPAPSSSSRFSDCHSSFGARENVRSAIRYSLRADVVVNWIGENGLARQSRGYTRDISPGGAYIFAAEFPPAGHPVQINIHLPMFGGECRVPSVTVKGHVLRVDKPPLATESGFSVRSKRVTVCNA
jgi:PilZ domain